MNEQLKAVQEQIALSVLTGSSQYDEQKQRIFMDFITHATREFFKGWADCESGSFRGTSDAYSSGYWASHHSMERASCIEGEFDRYE